MKWVKIKNLCHPDNCNNLSITYASNPVADKISSSIFRVYFSSRDDLNRSFIIYCDIDFDNDFEVIDTCVKPILTHGKLGLFDDSGVTMSTIINVYEKKYLYYLGWNLKKTVPWQNSIGLSVLNNNSDIFEKISDAPILDRNRVDPYSISYPCIIFDNGLFKMWYGSNLSWGTNKSDMKHVIKYAESNDGINWKRENKICIDLENKFEYAISRPWVIKDDTIFRMWYSYRGKEKIESYRIGYAESINGINWIRKDNIVGIDVSIKGWDSEMICYASIVNYKDNLYMLYNGNNYGKTGFGIAVLENK